MQSISDYLQVDPEQVKQAFINVYGPLFWDYIHPFGNLPNVKNKQDIDTHIVSISGFIGSGKSTVAKYLELNGYHVVSFAGKLKDIVAYLFNLNRQIVEGDTSESRIAREQPLNGAIYEYINLKYPGITIRKILQLTGTEVFREHFGPNFWVDRVNFQGKCVCSDARFISELKHIEKYPSYRIRLIRGDVQPDAHISETEHLKYTGFTHIIDNQTSIENLYHQLDNIFKN